MPEFLLPVKMLVATALAAAHSALSSLGLDPDSGLTWALAITGLVIGVRLLLLPATAHGVRLARASAKARPALTDLRQRYAGRRDVDSLRALRQEQRAIQSEHGVPSLGCLPLLLQLPILFTLYGVLADVANGRAIGAMDAALVASAGSASFLGVRLAERWSWGGSPTQVAVVAGLAVVSAALSYATQRWFVLPNMVLDGLPEPMADVQRLMPALSAVGLLIAAGAVPVGLLVYWVAGNAWTLGQQAIITRWFPTPGSPASQRRMARVTG